MSILIDRNTQERQGDVTKPQAFTAVQGMVASSTLPIPRFIATSTARSIINIQLRRTRLLFPFVTNTSGFDTGISISNPDFSSKNTNQAVH